MTDSNATELLPCPFCGGEPYYYAPGPAEHHIECVQCHAETDGWMKKEQAIEAWNTRTPDESYKQAAEYWRQMYEEAIGYDR